MQLTLACRNKENLPKFRLGTAKIMEDQFDENLGKFSSQSSGHIASYGLDQMLRSREHVFFWKPPLGPLFQLH